MGKPNALMMRAALRYMQAHSEQTCIIGDNMDTDVIAGINSGLETVLVLSGVSRAEELPRYPYKPHHVVQDAAALVALLEELRVAIAHDSIAAIRAILARAVEDYRPACPKAA